VKSGNGSGISFIDATSIAICHNRRINSSKVFRRTAKRGQTSIGWFYGFKVHLVIIPGNVDDRKPVERLSQRLFGKLFGDRGYISQALFKRRCEQGVQLITKLKKNLKNKLMPLVDKLLLRKRALIETVNDQIKNICQIEQTRHRSVADFIVNLIAALIAYTYQEKKPSLNLRHDQLAKLPPVVFQLGLRRTHVHLHSLMIDPNQRCCGCSLPENVNLRMDVPCFLACH